MIQQFEQPISDLGFGPENQLGSTNNYPDGFVTFEQIELEGKMNLEIIEDNGN